MNPLLSALGYLATGNVAKQGAKALTRRSVAGADDIRKVVANVEASMPASIRGTSGASSVVPSPSMVEYGVMPRLSQPVRQAQYDTKYANQLAEAESVLGPLLGKTRNVGLGTGIGLGAIPPSLLALYLLAQEDNEE